jgi:hypothetical protein
MGALFFVTIATLHLAGSKLDRTLVFGMDKKKFAVLLSAPSAAGLKTTCAKRQLNTH